MPLLSESIGGFSAGVVGTVIGFPLDLVKTRMQTGSSLSCQSMSSTFRDVVVNEGVAGLYKGVAMPLLSLTILNTLNFSSYNHFKRVLVSGRQKCEGYKGVDYVGIFFAGSLAGPLASIVSTPEHMLKTQMQLDNLRKPAPIFTRGVIQASRFLVEKHGIRILYVGHASNTLREAVFLGTYFTTYEWLKQSLVQLSLVSVHVAIPVAGGMAGAAGWIVSFPLDCIKANIQGVVDPTKPSMKTRSIVLTGKEIVAKRGFAGIYSGIVPSVTRAFLVSGSRFSAYEFAVGAVESIIH